MSPVTASEKDSERTIRISGGKSCSRDVVYGRLTEAGGPQRRPSGLENPAMKSESLVRRAAPGRHMLWPLESSTARDCCVKLTIGGNWLLTLNSAASPIANKYCEGKLKQNFEKRVKPENVKLARANRKRAHRAAAARDAREQHLPRAEQRPGEQGALAPSGKLPGTRRQGAGSRSGELL